MPGEEGQSLGSCTSTPGRAEMQAFPPGSWVEAVLKEVHSRGLPLWGWEPQEKAVRGEALEKLLGEDRDPLGWRRLKTHHGSPRQISHHGPPR